jgi:RHS repeat-associated protein
MESFKSARRFAILCVALALVAYGMTVKDLTAEATGPSDIGYVYDELSRLVAVVDPANGTAKYAYDAVGNLTSIVRQSATIVSILEFTPNGAPVGTQVHIWGTGLGATPGDNTVRFNGVLASLISVSTYEIVAVVPAGATTGTISVTTPTGSATSSSSFSVTPPKTPTVTNVSPRIVQTAGAVTLTGTNFQTITTNNDVMVNINRAVVSSAAPTSITTVIPPATGSGRLTLRTPYGSVEAGDVFVPPGLITPADVEFTGRAQGGQVTNVPISANKVGLLAIDGVEGDGFFVRFSNFAFGSCVAVTLYRPDLVSLFAANVCGTADFDTIKLPISGTYTLLVDPLGASAGSMSIQVLDVPPDATQPIVIGGPSVTLATNAIGQNGALTFSGTAGQRIYTRFTNGTYPGCVNMNIVDPLGGPVQGAAVCGTPVDFDTVTLPSTGVYTIKVDPMGAITGQMTYQVLNVPPDPTGTISIGGPPVTVTTSIGQGGELTFSGTEDQTVTLAFTNSTYGGCVSVNVIKPNGQFLTGAAVCGTPVSFPGMLLPASGNYKIKIDPLGAAAGQMTYQLTDDGGRAPANASSKTQATKEPNPSAESRDVGRIDATGNSGGASPNIQPPGEEEWIPAHKTDEDWETDRPAAPWQFQHPLVGAPGVTALSGLVLTLNGGPLAAASLEIDGVRTQTDETGRFLLEDVEAGHHELLVDGTKAGSEATGSYGVFEIGVDLKAGRTIVLPFIVWMPLIDTTHAKKIESPTTEEHVITTPRIPGLEVHIPAGSVITDGDGHPVKELSITAVPLDRPPFPLPMGVQTPVYFTVQPGGAYLSKGAKIVYPNRAKLPPGTRVDFWQFDAEEDGWSIYGKGTVTSDGSQIVPDANVRVYEFGGAMINGTDVPPGFGPTHGGTDGDPVDLATGLFVLDDSDLVLPDVLPISLTRTYRQSDAISRPFGIGTTHPYAMFLYSQNQFQEADLILPDGARVHYVRTSPGIGYFDAVFEHTSTPTAFFKSKIAWNFAKGGWNLTLKDGTVYHFGEGAPLQSIRDRHGNELRIVRDGGGTQGNIRQVRSPNGRWIEFVYDGSNRITQAKDNAGRTVGYTYDGNGRLWKITDANGKVTEYGYEGTTNRMSTIKDPRLITYLTNEYDANGRIFKQTQVDGNFYQFAYALDGSGKVTETDVTDPRGFVRRVTFNASGRMTSDTRAVGQPQQQQVTYELEAGTNLLLSATDALARKTSYTYYPTGNVETVTRLADTPDAVTTTFTYEPAFNQVETIADPLGHTTRFIYTAGKLTTIRDPLLHDTTMTHNAAGQVTSVTDALENTTEFGYQLGDAFSVEDPLGHVATQFVDTAGRVTSKTDPMGAITLSEYDKLNQLLKTTDPLGGLTQFTYDENGNLRTVKDARNNTTTFTPNSMDWTASRKDPLNRTESYLYDGLGNLTKHTSRKNQVTTFTYDPQNRLNFIGFNTRIVGGQTTYASTITYGYDAGNRLRTAVDSLAGSYARDYDGLDRLTLETSPQGQVSYGYDDADRRETMTVAGQPQTTYGYDDADRLLSVTRSSQQVAYEYDDANRPTLLTLPGGVTQSYGYNIASQLTGITYKAGAATIGTLVHDYDAAGRRASQGGNYARTGLPDAVASFAHNANNQMTARGGTPLTYDQNGNLTGDGTYTYTWDPRNHLSQIKQGTPTIASYVYDPFERRQKKTASGTTTQYLYDGLNPIQEKVGATPSANLVGGLGIDQHHTRTDSAGQRSLLTDALGSTIALADNAGAVQTSYTYEPFGKSSTSGAANSNTYQYTGREADAASLTYYRARFYSPTMQRFISEDPVGFGAGDANLYGYVLDSPTNLIDPLGLDPCLQLDFWNCDFSRVTTPIRTVGRAVGEGFEWWQQKFQTAGEWMVTAGRKLGEGLAEIGGSVGRVLGKIKWRECLQAGGAVGALGAFAGPGGAALGFAIGCILVNDVLIIIERQDPNYPYPSG